MDVAASAEALVRAGRRLGSRGLIAAGEGNLSLRIDADRLLITPAGRRKDELTVDDLVVIGLDDRKAEPRSASRRRPSSDVAIHLAVHRARPDIAAVVHAHLPAAMALTMAGERPDPAGLPETALLLPRLPVVPLHAPGSTELATLVAAAMTDGPPPFATAVLLERHGAVAVGEDVDVAVDRLDLVEVLCRTWRDALLIRAARAAVGMV